MIYVFEMYRLNSIMSKYHKEIAEVNNYGSHLKLTFGLLGTRIDAAVTTPKEPSEPINSCLTSYPGRKKTTYGAYN